MYMIALFMGLNLSGWTFLAVFIAYALAVLLSITLHEFSHGYVAYKCGDQTAKQLKRLSLNPFNHIDVFGAISFLLVGFGWAKPIPINPLNFRNFKKGKRLVAISGVITNLVLGIIFSGLYYFFGSALISSINIFCIFLGYFLMFSMIINFSLAIFNLLPIYPLDGFRFIETFFAYDNKFIQFMQRYGSLIMIIFIISPLFDLIYGLCITGLQNVLFSFWGLF